MNVVCLILLAVCGWPAAAPLSAQGVPPGVRPTARAGNTVLRMMVANPFVSYTTPAESVASVSLGATLRQGIQDRVGDDYSVVTKEQMNDALLQYGYSPDAILNKDLAVTLAKQISAWIVVTGTMAKGNDGLYTVTARLAGASDIAGSVSMVRQLPGERPADLGDRVAGVVAPGVKALVDARACYADKDAKPDKAIKAAERALKRVPNHALARYCLYDIAKKANAPRDTLVLHLEGAVAGDPQSVEALRALSTEYQSANDTAKTIATAKRLLQATPTDMELRKRFFSYLLSVGRQQMALDVAKEAIQADPNAVEPYNLKADACLYLPDFPCVVEALERVYALDSTRADTFFFKRMSAALAKVTPPDTAAIARWTRLGVAKHPNNLEMLKALHRMYFERGEVDSSIAVARVLIQRDTTPTTVRSAVQAVQMLTKANRIDEIAPFYDFIKRHGNTMTRGQLGRSILVVSRSALVGDTAAGRRPDLVRAATLAKSAIEVSDSGTDVWQSANGMLGTALLQQVVELDPKTEAQKSCDLAKQEQALVEEAKATFARVPTQPKVPEYLGYLTTYTTRVKSMLKSYCN